MQVVRGGGAMPGGVGEVPGHDVRGGCPAGPGVGGRNVEAGLDRDHDRCVKWSSKVATKNTCQPRGNEGAKTSRLRSLAVDYFHSSFASMGVELM